MPEIASMDLVSLLTNGLNLDTRRDAAVNLCRIKDAAMIPTLIAGLNDHEDVAIFCVLALVEQGRNTVPYIIKSIHSQNEQVRCYSAEIIGELKAEEGIPILMDTIKNDTSNWVKSSAIEALEMFDDPSIIHFLEEQTLQNDEWLKVASCISLQKKGYKRKDLFRFLLNDFFRVKEDELSILVWGLVEIGNKENIGELENLMEEMKENPKVQRKIEEIIMGINNHI